MSDSELYDRLYIVNLGVMVGILFGAWLHGIATWLPLVGLLGVVGVGALLLSAKHRAESRESEGRNQQSKAPSRRGDL